MEQNDLPIIDWELATRLAGNKTDVAEEMLTLLVNRLPDDTSSIKQSHRVQNYDELLRQVHKLHGAVCYCGLPRLKRVIAQLETELKTNIMDDLPSLLDQFETEVTLLLEQYSYLTLKSRNDSAA